MPDRTPSRDELRTAILWCARMLVSYDGQPFAGPIRVSVNQPDECEAKMIRPKGTLDGMEPPEWFSLGEEAGIGASVSDVLGVLASPDEIKVLTDLLAHQPCSASSVQERCRSVVSKSEFWSVWGQLQGRRIVEQGEDEMYRIRPEWLVKWLRVRRSGDRPAA